jgi:predicted ATPase
VGARLDGLPLALELAAAWLRTLTASELVAELDHRFALLVRGPRAVVARHETMLASMNWSRDMLSAAEQAVFRQLAVFAGRFTQDAARAVCALRGTGGARVLEADSRLVDKSLLVTGSDGGRMRYRHRRGPAGQACDAPYVSYDLRAPMCIRDCCPTQTLVSRP